MSGAGRISVERVSRVFRDTSQEPRTLRELVVRRRRAPRADRWALRDVSFAVEPAEAIGLVGRNGSGKSTLLRIVAGIVRPTSGRVVADGRIASLLELGAGFHRDFTGRENVYLNGSIHGLTRRTIDEHLEEIVDFAGLERDIDRPVREYSSGMYMRLGFAVAAHVEADVLLLDEVFAVGDEAFQRKCFGKISEFKQRGGTIVFVSHDANAVSRLCERAVLLRAGEVELDGPTHEALARYRQLLAAEADPEERAAGLREWGSGEARIASAELLDRDGDPRPGDQFLSGEPLVVRLVVEAREPVAAPRLSLELRDDQGQLLAGAEQDLAELGWAPRPGERELRLRLERLPLADGRFHLRFALLAPDGRHLHTLDDALRLLVYPAAEGRGPLRLEGRWTLRELPPLDERNEAA
jgi:ABC-type polysaccharide/polyol phosphate transport system ATPase subunit